MVQAVGEAKVLEDGWVDPLPSAPADTRLGVHGRVGRGTCTSEAAHGSTLAWRKSRVRVLEMYWITSSYKESLKVPEPISFGFSGSHE